MTFVQEDRADAAAAAAPSHGVDVDKVLEFMESGGSRDSHNITDVNGDYNKFLQFLESGGVGGGDGSASASKNDTPITSDHSDTGLLPSNVHRSDSAGQESGAAAAAASASRRSRMSLSRRASTTEERRNPFAYREGNALIWRNVSMTLKPKSGKQTEGGGRKLLNSVWGEVPPGEITAIMGPSGAGNVHIIVHLT